MPKKGFISGRVATPADVAAGNAAFSVSVGGDAVGKSTPLRIQIPQYAYYKEGRTKIPVIVLQAERIDMQKRGEELVQTTLFAALMADGTKITGLLTDFELLGRLPPKMK